MNGNQWARLLVCDKGNLLRSFFASAILSWHQPWSTVAQNFTCSSSGSGRECVVQQAAEALPPLDLACVVEVASLRDDELVRQALMISFGMIMGDQILQGCPQ